MIDAVLSYHLSPYTCGVAKFNQRLARELGVPCLRLNRYARYPLISIKISELPRSPFPTFFVSEGYDLFLHDWDDAYAQTVELARRVYAANEVIADAIRPIRPD